MSGLAAQILPLYDGMVPRFEIKSFKNTEESEHLVRGWHAKKCMCCGASWDTGEEHPHSLVGKGVTVDIDARGRYRDRHPIRGAFVEAVA